MAEEILQSNEGDGSLDSAALALKTAREALPQEPKEKPEDTPEADDTAPDATAATEDMPEVDDDSPDATPEDEQDTGQPTIDAPAGWTADDKAWFDTLEPARQEAILRREKGTQAAESRRQNEYNAALQKAQAIEQQAAQERQYLQSAIQQFRNPLISAFNQEFADVVSGQMDVLRLASDPARWPKFQAYQAKFSQIASYEKQLSDKAAAEEDARLQQHIEQRTQQILDDRPELKDPAKFEQFDNEVSSYLVGLEVPAERIQRISYKELQIVEKAMKWDKAQKARANLPKTPQVPNGQVAVASHVRTVPKVMKPGVSKGSGGTDDRIAALQQKSRESGSVDDAANLMRALRTRRAS
jgi:hypothetical protein